MPRWNDEHDDVTGSAYTLKPPTYNAKLTEVGRGTPMGELLRRYWHPVGLGGDAGATPRAGARSWARS